MPWAKFDDLFPDHPKVLRAGPMASWLFVCGVCYSARMLTDGFIPLGQVRKLADLDGAMQLAEILVEVGLWERTVDGFLIHDYLVYNPTRARVEQTRDVRSAAGRSGGKHSGVARSAAGVRGSKNEAICFNGASPVASHLHEAKSNPSPVPVPVPKPKAQNPKAAAAASAHDVPPNGAAAPPLEDLVQMFSDEDFTSDEIGKARAAVLARHSQPIVTNWRSYLLPVLRDLRAKALAEREVPTLQAAPPPADSAQAKAIERSKRLSGRAIA